MQELQPMSRNFFSFSTYVSKDIASFPSRIVDGIKAYFGFNAIYGIREIDSDGKVRICEFYGDSRYKRDYALYKEKLVKNEIFELNMAEMIKQADTTQKRVWRLQDLGYEASEFLNSEFGKLAEKSGFGYKAMIVSPQPLGKYYHSLSIYKPKHKGDFTEDEVSFLNQLAAIFDVMFNAYLSSLKQQSVLQLFNERIMLENKQVAVFSPHLDVLFKSQDFDKLSEKTIGKRKLGEMLLSLDMFIEERSAGCVYDEVHTGDNSCCRVKISVFVPSVGLSVNDNKLICVEITPQEYGGKERESISDVRFNEYGFTAREREVLELLMQNESIDGIAERLFMAKTTIRTHLSHIYKKLEVNSRLEAMVKLKGI